MTNTDAAADSAEEAAFSDHPDLESGASVTCVNTHPNVVPLRSDGSDTTCLFEVNPPLPSPEDLSYGVIADGVALPPMEYELHGREGIELTGQACDDYRAGKITNVAVYVACPA